MNRTTFPLRSLALALATAAALAAAGCTSQAETGPAMPPPPEVSVAPVLTKPVGQWDDFTGRVAAVDTVELRPRAPTPMPRMPARSGRARAGSAGRPSRSRPPRAACASGPSSSSTHGHRPTTPTRAIRISPMRARS